MKKYLWITAVVVAGLIGCLVAGPASAELQPKQRVRQSLHVLQQFVDIPENAIPPALLRSANGIAIIPDVLKFSFIFGGRHGNGIVAIRKPDGTWSKPMLVSLTSASFGFQAGASSTDIILIFKTRQSVREIANGQFQLGADAAVAAGPVGRHTGAATNIQMDAEIYSYSRSRGLFAGVAIQGGRISIDQKANWLFYNEAGVTGREILGHGKSLDLPKIGQRLVYTLNQYMPPSRSSNGAGSSSRDNAGSAGTEGGGSQGSSIGTAQGRKGAGAVSVQRQGS